MPPKHGRSLLGASHNFSTRCSSTIIAPDVSIPLHSRVIPAETSDRKPAVTTHTRTRLCTPVATPCVLPLVWPHGRARVRPAAHADYESLLRPMRLTRLSASLANGSFRRTVHRTLPDSSPAFTPLQCGCAQSATRQWRRAAAAPCGDGCAHIHHFAVRRTAGESKPKPQVTAQKHWTPKPSSKRHIPGT